jgi:cytidylate kinase
MIITIARQYGAGGAEIARRVAERLEWRVVDNDFIDRVAARAGLTPDEVAAREERVPGFIERLAWALASASAELAVPTGPGIEALSEPQLVRITEGVVAEVAREGRAVLVGRGAAAILGERERALHVRVVASPAVAAERIAGRLGVSIDEARKRIAEVDGRRTRYHKEFYGREWGDPINYHITLNTGLLGLDGAADLIVREAGRRGWAYRRTGNGEQGTGPGS